MTSRLPLDRKYLREWLIESMYEEANISGIEVIWQMMPFVCVSYFHISSQFDIGKLDIMRNFKTLLYRGIFFIFRVVVVVVVMMIIIIIIIIIINIVIIIIKITGPSVSILLKTLVQWAASHTHTHLERSTETHCTKARCNLVCSGHWHVQPYDAKK